jgi:hypothetical protein
MGQAERDRKNGTGRTRQAEQVSHDRASITGKAEQHRQIWTGRSEQAEGNSRTGQTERNRQKGMGITRHVVRDRLNRTGRQDRRYCRGIT